MIAEEAKNISEVRFVWITDGAGWRSAQKNLHETFDILETKWGAHREITRSL
jgi:type II restriction enzyme